MKNICLAIVFISLLICSCKKNSSGRSIYNCSSDNAIIDTLQNVEGVINHSYKFSNYAIQVAEPNTIDVVNVYILCTSPSFNPKEGEHVKFSGYIRQSSYKPESQVWYNTFYDIELTNIKEE